MNISRRSFLKMAGLTTVAAAGAAMFTGCGLDMVTVNMVIVDQSQSLGWKDNKTEGSTKLFAFMVKDTVKVSDVQKAIDTMPIPSLSSRMRTVPSPLPSPSRSKSNLSPALMRDGQMPVSFCFCLSLVVFCKNS